jgi:hypothetical protein
MPSGSMYELRYYPSFESVANLNDPTQYYLVSNQVGTSASDITPFSIATLQGGTFVKLSLCMRTSTYDKRLGMNTYQASQINTLARVDSYICPKVNQ